MLVLASTVYLIDGTTRRFARARPDCNLFLRARAVMGQALGHGIHPHEGERSRERLPRHHSERVDVGGFGE